MVHRSGRHQVNTGGEKAVCTIDGALQQCRQRDRWRRGGRGPCVCHVHPSAGHHPAGDAAEDGRSGCALLLLGSTCFPLKSPKSMLLIGEIDSVLKSQSSCVYRLIDEDHMSGLQVGVSARDAGRAPGREKYVGFVLTVGATNFSGTDSAMHFIFRIYVSILWFFWSRTRAPFCPGIRESGRLERPSCSTTSAR